jgi:hypothetical protein
MKLIGTIFDKHGTTYNVDNIDIYVGEMKDRLLINTYTSTIYFHELTLVMESLVKKGLAKEAKLDEEYNPQLTENAISSMRDEIIERFDEEYHEYVISKIDLSFVDKKPKGI